MTRHRWGEKVRFPNKTEQQCIQCGLVKVGRHGGVASHVTRSRPRQNSVQ